MVIYRDEAERLLETSFTQNLVGAFKSLLEEKHLYQNVLVRTDFIKPILDDTQPENRRYPNIKAEALVENRWWTIAPPPTATGYVFIFKPPDIKLFCQKCDRREAYNLVTVDDFLKYDPSSNDELTPIKPTRQVFVISYRCQSCKKSPEVFLIERNGLKLTLGGRTPIEIIEIPQVIPKILIEYISGALLAYHCNQVLAGNFLLRTAIEQWARSRSQNRRVLASEIIDDYMASLPEDFKARFTSFHSLYDELSADIHNAVGSADLFEKANKALEEHFAARKIFKLTENT